MGWRGANVRKEPKSASALVETLAEGTLVTVLETVQGDEVSGNTRWHRIQYRSEQTGYVSASLLVPLAMDVKFESVPNEDLARYSRLYGSEEVLEEGSLVLAKVDLDGRGDNELILVYTDSATCGSAGCDGTYARVTRADGEKLSDQIQCNWVEVGADISQGFRNLICAQSYSGIQTRYVFAWDGCSYRRITEAEPGNEPEMSDEAYECKGQQQSPSTPALVTSVPVATSPSVPAAFEAQPPGKPFRDALKSGGEGPEMVVIPSGSFLMGSPANEAERTDDEGPQRQVQVASFAMGRTEVTLAQYDRFATATGRERPSDEGWGRGERPVINVTWEDASAYAQWLSEQTGQRYRLPSEAEWEYAVRAGTPGPFSFDAPISPAKANYNSNAVYAGSRKDSAGDREKTVPAGSLPANPWGLHEVHGNVWEWVADCWHDDYQGAPGGGEVWAGGDCGRRVLRGGSWDVDPVWLRSASRNWFAPLNRDSLVGFRLARTF